MGGDPAALKVGQGLADKFRQAGDKKDPTRRPVDPGADLKGPGTGGFRLAR